MLEVNSRVRVKFGIDRGHYGTITHVGGDAKNYFGVKLDCHDREVGYSEYELEEIRPPRSREQQWRSMRVQGVYVPKEVAVCPECRGELAARSMEWEAETNRPTEVGIELDCMNDLRDGKRLHRWWQSDWQCVRDRIAKWCGARKESEAAQ
jgi:hypothetical protein